MIQVMNYGQFAGGLEARARKLSIMVQAAVDKTGNKIVKDTVKNTPTGRYPEGSGRVGGTLKKGWQGSPDGKWAFKISNDVEYAPFVEFGTSKMGGRFMLSNAHHANIPVLKRNVNFAIRQAVS